MKLFNFFRKNKDADFPEQYKGIITPGDYRVVLDIVKKYHAEKGLIISGAGRGEIVVEVAGVHQHRYLDNLVRILPGNNKDKWAKIIYGHFDKLKDHSSAYNFLFKDLEYSAQFLRVLIKGSDLYKDELDHFVTRCDFPETNTFLVLEYEQQFRYVTKENIAEWGKSPDELFDIALSNTPGDEVEVKECIFADKFTVYMFLSGDYSPSLLLNVMVAGGDFGRGAYGAMIAIPAKGAAFIHPIESGEILELVKILAPTVDKFYNEDPGSITTNFYWLYGDKIEKFPTGEDGNGYYVRLPQPLLEIFRE